MPALGAHRRRLLRPAAAVALAWLLASTAAAQALLTDVTLTTAISAVLNPAIQLPRGSLRAVGSGADALVARVSDHEHWSDWEVYAGSGLVATLRDALVHNLATEFAVAGLFQRAHSEQRIGAETHSRYEFDDGAGSALLYVIETSREVVWMIARKP